LRHINLTLGPNGSYFTPTKSTPLYRDIPNDLHEQIQSSPKQPRQVALGRHKSWVCLWDDDSISWSVDLNYENLTKRLQEFIDRDHKVAFVALNPFDNYSWFLVDSRGQCGWSLKSLGDKEVATIQQLAQSYLQYRARADGTTFTETVTIGDKKTSTIISPSTYFDKTSSTPSAQFRKNVSTLGQRLPTGQRRQQAIAVGATSFITASTCKLMGLGLRPSLISGGVSGATVLAVLMWPKGT